MLSIATVAQAQTGATLSLFSDARFRGYSISGGRPIALVDLSFDAADGLYAGASASAVVQHGGPRPLQLQINGGYAKRLSSGNIVDVGLLHARFSSYSAVAASKSYTEIYASFTRKFLTSRIYVSPHYFETGGWTTYGELEANFSPASKWHLTGHTGVLVPLTRAVAGENSSAEFDWRIGVTRELGRVSLHTSISGGDGRDTSPNRGTAVVLGLSLGL